MVVFDAATLLFIFSNHVGSPKDPATGRPVDRAQERVELRLRELEKHRTKVIIPTPALAEILVHAGAAAPEQLAKIGKSGAFRVVDFDQRAAVQVALMAQDRGDRPKNQTDTYAKLKYDRQIAAIAKVEGATAIYTDDERLRGYAKRLNIAAIGLADLPLPAPPQAETMDLFAETPEKDGNDVDQVNEPETGTEDASGREPNGEVPEDREGVGLQPEPSGVREEVGGYRAGEADRDAESESESEEELTLAEAAPNQAHEIDENPQVAGSNPVTSTDHLDGGVAQRESGGLNEEAPPLAG